MDENFIVDLPPEANDTDFFVTAPSGGLQSAISLLIGGLTDYIDLDIQSGHRHGRFRRLRAAVPRVSAAGSRSTRFAADRDRVPGPAPRSRHLRS